MGSSGTSAISISINTSALRSSRIDWNALIDRGANGSIAGRDMKVISRTARTINLSGIDDHTVRNLTLVTAGGVVDTPQGEIILIIHQTADMTLDSRTILSAGQLEAFGCKVYEKSPLVTQATPFLVTPGGYRVPMSIRKGLPYIRMRPFGEKDWNDLPHVAITSPAEWDPSILDSDVPSQWYRQQPPTSNTSLLTTNGELRDDPDDSLDESDSDRRHQSVDRGRILAYLTRLVIDELDETDGYVLNVKTRRQRVQDGEPLASPDSSPFNTRRHSKRYKHSKRGKKPKKITTNLETTHNNSPADFTLSDGENADTSTPIASTVDDDDSDDDQAVPVGTSLDYNNPAKSLDTSPRYAMKPSSSNHAQYAQYFPGTNLATIKATLDATTQLGTRGAVEGFNLKDRIIAPNPVLSIPRRHEDVATDTLYSRTPAVDDGSTAAQFFIGRRSQFRSIAPMGTSDKQFAYRLMDEIRKYGAMDKLISDNAKAQVSSRVKDILRTFYIKDWHSEPYKGNQNFAERGWKDTKTKVNNLLNMTGAPSDTWLLALSYICFVQNHTAVKSLGNRTPIEWLLGYTPDITVLLQFQFWEPVLYAKYDAKFPADSTESLGRFVGIAETVGSAMTFKVLTEEGKIIHRSIVRSAALEGAFVNRRAEDKAKGSMVAQEEEGATQDEDAEEPETTQEDDTHSFDRKIQKDILRSRREQAIRAGKPLMNIDTSALLGRTFINDPDTNGEQVRAKIEDIAPTGDWTADRKQRLFRFRASIGEKRYEKVLTYNKMLEWCDRDMHLDGYYEIDGILNHRKDKNAGLGYMVQVKWGDGTITWNDLKMTFNDDPVTVSLYAQRNKLLETEGWKRCKRYVSNQKKLSRMINQARLKSNRTRPVYKYGFQVPRNHNEALKIDEKSGKTLWQDAEKLEVDQLFEYATFEDQGLQVPVPDGYTNIPTHFVYDVKHDGRHKARMVAGGHRTETPVDSVYSGVVTLAGVRIVTFLAELNNLELWGTDIGNAYLESYTKEKVCFTAGPEFGTLEGHTFIIRKALYGLRSSGARWHDRLYDTLKAMNFNPSKFDADIWMRDCEDHYEYIACYVDDLMIASKNPQGIIDALAAAPNNFKLKGTGPVTFHLGCDFFRDEDGTLCVGPRKYIDRMALQYEALFGTKPKATYTSPLLSNDHPEMDLSELLDEEGVHQYQSLIGVLQWTISLGRFDVATAVMTMSGFRVAPRVGHLERVKRICGYLCKMKHGFIRIRTDPPDYSDLQEAHYDWERTVYGDVKEEQPRNTPRPLGKPVVMTSYVDANLYHDMITGRSVSAVLHFLNQTPIEWFSKKQPTVETATYGSEFVAAKLAVQQIIALRIGLRYLGVEVQGSTRLFGDNGSVVKSGSMPHSPLRKRHHALAYHYTREAIASNAVDFQFLPGHLNPADILSKHWGYQQVWASALRPILFWRGDTSELLLDETQPTQRKPKDIMAEVMSEPEPTISTPDNTPSDVAHQTKGSDKIFD